MCVRRSSTVRRYRATASAAAASWFRRRRTFSSVGTLANFLRVASRAAASAALRRASTVASSW